MPFFCLLLWLLQANNFHALYLSTLFLPMYCPCVHFKFINGKRKPFLAVFFSQRLGWLLAEWAQQQTSDLLLPSISYPQTSDSLFPISSKTNSRSHPSYLRFKTLLRDFKGSVCLLKDSDARFIFGSRVYSEQE